MKFEEYVSGTKVQQYQYKSFLPSLINMEWTWEDPRINRLLEEASAALAELNAYSRFAPDVDRYIRMHVVKEANTSSKIEGTRTEMDDVLRDRLHVAEEIRDDWQEVQNYIQAMHAAIGSLETLPLSIRLLRETHAILMEGVRGEHKTPGEVRRTQNWIGGASISDAVFIPPHIEALPELLTDLERFWHNDKINTPHLIRIAISHYQFETIHPFLDGNGRIGRLLITLYLISEKMLAKPCLYLSAYIEKHKGQYYDALTTVRESNDMGQWVRFFLVAVSETARKGLATFQSLMELRQDMNNRIMELGARMGNGARLLEGLYDTPIVTPAGVRDHLEVSYPTATGLIEDFVKLGILVESTGQKRNREYVFKEYYELFDEN